MKMRDKVNKAMLMANPKKANKLILYGVVSLLIVFFLMGIIAIFFNQTKYNYSIYLRSSNTGFTKAQIDVLKKEGYFFTYQYSTIKEVTSALRTERCMITMTNSNYAEITDLKITEGSFFNERQEEKYLNPVIINSNLAWELFGSLDVIGQYLTIDGNQSAIIGLFEENAPVEKYRDIIMPLYFVGDEVPDHIIMQVQKKDMVKRAIEIMGVEEMDVTVSVF